MLIVCWAPFGPKDSGHKYMKDEDCAQVQGSPPGYDINYVLFGLDGKDAASRMHDGKLWDKYDC